MPAGNNCFIQTLIFFCCLQLYAIGPTTDTKQAEEIIFPHSGVRNGTGWATSKDEETAGEVLKLLTRRKDALTRALTGLKTKLETVIDPQEKNCLEICINEFSLMISDISSSITEIEILGSTKEMTFAFNELGTNLAAGFLSTKREKSGKVVTYINYTHSSDPKYPNSLYANLAHELTHAYQFLTKKMVQTTAQIGTDNFTFDSKLLKDLLEVEAYQRQYAFDGPFRKNVAGINYYYPYQAEHYTDIDRKWLLEIKDWYGTYIYR
jgi:hypothetical protein